MRLSYLLTPLSDAVDKAKVYVSDVLAFLKTHLGSDVLAFATLGIIGFLAFALLICTILAIFNPKKRKLKKLKRTLKKQKEYDTTRQRVFQISEEITTLDLEIRFLNKQLEDDLFNLAELERSAVEQDNLFITNQNNKIEDLKENQAILTQVLEQKQKGILKSMQKEKMENTKLLIAKMVSEQRTYHNEIYYKTQEIEKRKAQLDADIAHLKSVCQEKTTELNNKITLLTHEKNHLEAKLDKMDKKGRHKLTITDAKAMIDEFTKNKRIADDEAEAIALEELKKAKQEYELAKERRSLAEKNKALAVENVKTMQKERAKSKNSKPLKYTPVTEASFVPGDKPDDVNIIIADITGDAVFTPVIAEETVVEDTVEHVYEEPSVEVVNIDNLPEEDVVFIEAFLDDLIDEDEEQLEEVAVTEDHTPTETTVEDPIEASDQEETKITEENPTDTATVEIIVEDVELEKEESPTQTELNTEEPSAEVELTISQPEIIVEPNNEPKAKKQPAYKDYNDGIPATPIYKTNKYQKPVTKLVKKAKDVNENSQAPATENKVKAGYNGKWKIEQLDGKYLAKLFASNGGLLLVTPAYMSVNGVKDCIEKVKDSLLSDRVTIISSKDGKHFFKVSSISNRTILQSSKYSTKYQCEKALASTKRFIQTAIIL